jgi:hypothetical protein
MAKNKKRGPYRKSTYCVEHGPFKGRAWGGHRSKGCKARQVDRATWLKGEPLAGVMAKMEKARKEHPATQGKPMVGQRVANLVGVLKDPQARLTEFEQMLNIRGHLIKKVEDRTTFESLHGFVIDEIQEGSVQAAGLKKGDVVVKIGADHAVHGFADLCGHSFPLVVSLTRGMTPIKVTLQDYWKGRKAKEGVATLSVPPVVADAMMKRTGTFSSIQKKIDELDVKIASKTVEVHKVSSELTDLEKTREEILSKLYELAK